MKNGEYSGTIELWKDEQMLASRIFDSRVRRKKILEEWQLRYNFNKCGNVYLIVKLSDLDQKLYRCTDCGKTFTTINLISAHLKIATNTLQKRIKVGNYADVEII